MTWTGEVYNDGELEPVELMQLTGLYDKNGKPVYDGDVLGIAPNRPLYTIVWRDAFADFGV